MSQRDAYDTIGAILSIHAMISGFLADATADIPEERMAEQPGGIVNHPAWTISHLNAYSGLMLSMFGDSSVPTVGDEMARFGYGTTPVPNRAAYPSKRELLERFRDRNARVSAVVAAKHSDYFPRPAPAPYLAHAPTIGHLAITLLVGHPPHHLGQLRQWRRTAGIAERS
ncbi:MAG: DinB family protein [Phycisphaerales bacterium]|nr:DinB family protein [Planctomycetota bacterium]